MCQPYFADAIHYSGVHNSIPTVCCWVVLVPGAGARQLSHDGQALRRDALVARDAVLLHTANALWLLAVSLWASAGFSSIGHGQAALVRLCPQGLAALAAISYIPFASGTLKHGCEQDVRRKLHLHGRPGRTDYTPVCLQQSKAVPVLCKFEHCRHLVC